MHFKAYFIVFGREFLSVNSVLFFHLSIVFFDTAYLKESPELDTLLLLILVRKRTFVVALAG